MVSLKYVAITVRDLDRSIRFYSEIFGFKLLKVKSKPEFGVTYAHLKAGEVDLELLTPLKGEPQTQKSTGDDLTTKLCEAGLNHIALKVENLGGICERLRAWNVRFLMEPKFSGGSGTAFVLDPEGNLLELSQEP